MGIEMISVPMRPNGPDIDAVEQLVAADPTIKAMWVVPTYANPTGYTVTDDVARRLATMPTAAPDFRILWDNAYAVHHLTETAVPSADIGRFCAEAGNPDRWLYFASTSKITLPGAGVAFFGGSDANVAWLRKRKSFQTIGPDKINHLRHAMFLDSPQAVLDHMDKHREILAPKFQAVLRILGDQLSGIEGVTWTTPLGGYFVSLDVVPGTAARVVELASQAGVALTPAGATFPYGKDPLDQNIRLSPSMPPLADVEAAMEAVTTCVLLAAAEVAAR
jgi:DNA-binding transcriptional MocR family regulator